MLDILHWFIYKQSSHLVFLSCFTKQINVANTKRVLFAPHSVLAKIEY